MPLQTWGGAKWGEERYGWTNLPAALDIRRKIYSGNAEWINDLGISIPWRCNTFQFWTIDPNTYEEIEPIPNVLGATRTAESAGYIQRETLSLSLYPAEKFLPGGEHAHLITMNTLIRPRYMCKSQYGSEEIRGIIYRITSEPERMYGTEAANPITLICEDFFYKLMREYYVPGMTDLSALIPIRDAALAQGCPTIGHRDSAATMAQALIWTWTKGYIIEPEQWDNLNWWGTGAPPGQFPPEIPPIEVPHPPPGTTPPPEIAPYVNTTVSTDLIGDPPIMAVAQMSFYVTWDYTGDDNTEGDWISWMPPGATIDDIWGYDNHGDIELGTRFESRLYTGGVRSGTALMTTQPWFNSPDGAVAGRLQYFHRVHGLVGSYVEPIINLGMMAANMPMRGGAMQSGRVIPATGTPYPRELMTQVAQTIPVNPIAGFNGEGILTWLFSQGLFRINFVENGCIRMRHYLSRPDCGAIVTNQTGIGGIVALPYEKFTLKPTTPAYTRIVHYATSPQVFTVVVPPIAAPPGEGTAPLDVGADIPVAQSISTEPWGPILINEIVSDSMINPYIPPPSPDMIPYFMTLSLTDTPGVEKEPVGIESFDPVWIQQVRENDRRTLQAVLAQAEQIEIQLDPFYPLFEIQSRILFFVPPITKAWYVITSISQPIGSLQPQTYICQFNNGYTGEVV